nr:hypothetical transcript [Hymenolepis microstoma]
MKLKAKGHEVNARRDTSSDAGGQFWSIGENVASHFEFGELDFLSGLLSLELIKHGLCSYFILKVNQNGRLKKACLENSIWMENDKLDNFEGKMFKPVTSLKFKINELQRKFNLFAIPLIQLPMCRFLRRLPAR